jgi:hypothetical protein
MATTVPTTRARKPRGEQPREQPAPDDCAITNAAPTQGDTLAAMKTSTPTSQPTISIHFSSRSEEWYTPSDVIDRVIATLGTIDLDPQPADFASAFADIGTTYRQTAFDVAA